MSLHLCLAALWVEASNADAAATNIQAALKNATGKGRGTVVAFQSHVPDEPEFWDALAQFQIYWEDLLQ